MFSTGNIWGYPTDTSFGLGVRIDDTKGLQKLADLKGGRDGKFFSIMCKDADMLRTFAEVPDDLNLHNFFFKTPRTIILRPKDTLPKSPFWPKDKVAFRINTIPQLDEYIDIPITATSANISGEPPIYTVQKLTEAFGDSVHIYDERPELPKTPPSEIWDYTETPPKRIR